LDSMMACPLMGRAVRRGDRIGAEILLPHPGAWG
jgi:hypothetical protein